MKATIDGVTYEGSEDEIRRIVSDPPPQPAVRITFVPRFPWPPQDYPRKWDGTPIVTC